MHNTPSTNRRWVTISGDFLWGSLAVFLGAAILSWSEPEHLVTSFIGGGLVGAGATLLYRSWRRSW